MASGSQLLSSTISKGCRHTEHPSFGVAASYLTLIIHTSNNLLRWPWELASCLVRLGCNIQICYTTEMDWSGTLKWWSAVEPFLLHLEVIRHTFLIWILFHGFFSCCYVVVALLIFLVFLFHCVTIILPVATAQRWYDPAYCLCLMVDDTNI